MFDKTDAVFATVEISNRKTKELVWNVYTFRSKYFNNTEWSDGKLPVSSYTPTQIDTDDWARTAYLAGMHYGGKTYKYNTRDV